MMGEFVVQAINKKTTTTKLSGICIVKTCLINVSGIFLCVVKDLRLVARGPVNAIQQINCYPADSAVCFDNTYTLDSDLSGG